MDGHILKLVSRYIDSGVTNYYHIQTTGIELPLRDHGTRCMQNMVYRIMIIIIRYTMFCMQRVRLSRRGNSIPVVCQNSVCLSVITTYISYSLQHYLCWKPHESRRMGNARARANYDGLGEGRLCYHRGSGAGLLIGQTIWSDPLYPLTVRG